MAYCFTTTDNRKYTKLGYVPKPWIHSLDTHQSYRDVIIWYFNKYIRIYDADVCGHEVHDFLFNTDKAFRLEYSWWISWHNDDDELNGFQCSWDITEITPDEANVPNKINRDILVF